MGVKFLLVIYKDRVAGAQARKGYHKNFFFLTKGKKGGLNGFHFLLLKSLGGGACGLLIRERQGLHKQVVAEGVPTSVFSRSL
jgi:hypothetical protein